MDEEEQDVAEVLETPQEEVIEIELDPEQDDATNEAETLRKENEDLKRKNAQLFERAKKNPKTEEVGTTARGLSTTDFYALTTAKVQEEDIQEVTDYASYKKITIAEALKTSAIKAILAERKENRDVAEATNAGRSRRQVTAQSSDVLLERASKGDLPATDSGLDALVAARMERRKAAAKN